VELMAIDKNCCWFEYKTGFVVSVARAVCITVLCITVYHCALKFCFVLQALKLIAGRFVVLCLVAV
jgi:hypothetical protein